MNNETNIEIKQLGQNAYDALQKAVEEGDTTDFLNLMDDDVTFFVSFPFEEWRGEQRGRERIAQLIKFQRDEMQVRIKYEQIGTTVNGNTCAVEFRVAGTNAGGDYRNHLAVFFDFENGKVKSWREYTGDVDAKAIAHLAKQS